MPISVDNPRTFQRCRDAIASQRQPATAPWAGLALLLVVSCSPAAEEPEPLPRCVDLETDCALLYQPTFSEIYRRTLLPTCAEEGTACHSSAGRRAGLVLEGEDTAYAELLDPSDPRVVPGDAECSLIMVRLEHPGSSVMPPGGPLSAAERCTIATWIRGGALRD